MEVNTEVSFSQGLLIVTQTISCCKMGESLAPSPGPCLPAHQNVAPW